MRRYLLAVIFGLMFWGVLGDLYRPTLDAIGLYKRIGTRMCVIAASGLLNSRFSLANP